MAVIAIDFETANRSRASACALGLAWIEDLRVVRREYRLIRPRSDDFEPINIAIHGIRPRDVVSAPEFPEVYAEFEDDFVGALLLAHNAPFDLSVLRETAKSYGIGTPGMRSLCTLGVARAVWPQLGNFKLSSLASAHGIEFSHHHAGEDAFACAQIAIKGAPSLAARNVEELGRRTGQAKAWPAVDARPLPRRGGIAERALNAMRPQEPAKETAHQVRGSNGAVYTGDCDERYERASVGVHMHGRAVLPDVQARVEDQRR